MKVSAPFNYRVPKGIRENLAWRQAVHKRVLIDPDYAGVIRDACAKDPLFFINGFGWTYDPRRSPFPKLPFILYEFQEEALLELIRAIGSHDVLVEKSRDMGASWLCISAVEWCWQWKTNLSFLFGSRVEDYVDQPGNPKSMFWKLDYLLDNQPKWLQPIGYSKGEHRRKLHIENPETMSVIDGESTQGNFARGDRRTAVVLDEFAAVDQGRRILAATRDATPCRIFNSTPAGTGDAFYEMRQTDIKKLRLHWSEHPIKAAGLYATDESGKLKVLDPAGYPEGYEPALDGKLRSPWYDNECKRAASTHEIAQELDIDYLGSGYQYFNAALVQEAIRKFARPPSLVGDLEYDDLTAEPIRFREDPQGCLRLWLFLDKDGKPPKGRRYVVANDISAGTGASNSCAVIYDEATCEKLGEYTNPHIRPEAFAKQSVAIARWFGMALEIWESNGPGRQFGSRVMELLQGARCDTDVYYRKRDEAISGKQTDIPGWASTKETKLVLMGDYRAAIEKLEMANRSKEALEETLEYVFGPDGSVMHVAEGNKVDPSGARSNHGDRVIADALALKAMRERAGRPKPKAPTVPVGSLAWRNQMREQGGKKSNRELPSDWR